MVNTLVKHKKLKLLGIGCISKELKSSYRVNFGLEGVSTCKKLMIETVDISKCSTVPFSDYKNRILIENSELNYAIVGNELKHFVGIGWITRRVITEEDLTKYPRVV